MTSRHHGWGVGPLLGHACPVPPTGCPRPACQRPRARAVPGPTSPTQHLTLETTHHFWNVSSQCMPLHLPRPLSHSLSLVRLPAPLSLSLSFALPRCLSLFLSFLLSFFLSLSLSIDRSIDRSPARSPQLLPSPLRSALVLLADCSFTCIRRPPWGS